MKRTIVLRIESERIEEYEIQAPEWGSDILNSVFNDQIWMLPKKERKEILLKIIRESSDEELVFYALPILETKIKCEELYKLFKKHINSEDVQWAIIWYAEKQKNKKMILRRIQKETQFDEIRREVAKILEEV